MLNAFVTATTHSTGVQHRGPHAGDPEGHPRHDLEREARERREPAHVVGQADARQQDAAHEHREELPVRAGRDRRDQQQAGGHRHTPEIGGGLVVGFVPARAVQHVEAMRGPARDRREQQRGEHRDHERERVPDGGGEVPPGVHGAILPPEVATKLQRQ
jgi:hypothetical protein